MSETNLPAKVDKAEVEAKFVELRETMLKFNALVDEMKPGPLKAAARTAYHALNFFCGMLAKVAKKTLAKQSGREGEDV